MFRGMPSRTPWLPRPPGRDSRGPAARPSCMPPARRASFTSNHPPPAAWPSRPRGSRTWCPASGRRPVPTGGRGSGRLPADPASVSAGCPRLPEVIDRFRWTDEDCRPEPGRPGYLRAARRDLHAGGHVPRGEGTLASTPSSHFVVELMPLGDFPGERNWATTRRAVRTGALLRQAGPSSLRQRGPPPGPGVRRRRLQPPGLDGAYLPAFTDFFSADEPMGAQLRRERQRVGAGLLSRARGHVGRECLTAAAGCNHTLMRARLLASSWPSTEAVAATQAAGRS
jgi:hypothetical protein